MLRVNARTLVLPMRIVRKVQNALDTHRARIPMHSTVELISKMHHPRAANLAQVDLVLSVLPV